MRGLFRYEQKNTVMHKLDPRAKLIWVIGISVLTIVLGDPLLLLMVFLSTIPFWIILKPSKSKIKAILLVFASMVFGFMISQSFFYYWGRDPLFTLIPADVPVIGSLTGGIHVYSEGVIYGLIQSFRFLASVSAAMVLVATTHPSELIIGLVRFANIKTNGLKNTNWIGFPYEIAFMVSSAVSFAPSMIEESIIIINAMRARGLKIEGGIRNKIKALRYIFFPMVVNILRKGRQMAIAADARAFRATKNRTFVRELKFKRMDYVYLGYTFVLVCLGLYLSFIGYGGTAPGWD
ncbi:MAG: energy-coupling factor transporter transmembrane component T family protein [Methanosarcinales archaeon]